MLITKEIEIDLAHRIPNHNGKCYNIHGHRYKVEVGVNDKLVSEEGSSDEGTVIDFSDLKAIMMEEIDEKFDHSLCVFEDDILFPIFKSLEEGESVHTVHGDVESYRPFKIVILNFISTAENFAKYLYFVLKGRLSKKDISIAHVKVWETPTCTAVYTKSDEESELES